MLLKISTLTCKLLLLAGRHHTWTLSTACHNTTFLWHGMAKAAAIASAIGLSILLPPFRHNPRLDSVRINGVRHMFVTYHLVIGQILTPLCWMQTSLDSKLRRLDHILLGFSKVNVTTLVQGFRIDFFGLLWHDVSIPGVKIGNLRNIYNYIRQKHIRNFLSEVKSAASVQVLAATWSIIIKGPLAAWYLWSILTQKSFKVFSLS